MATGQNKKTTQRKRTSQSTGKKSGNKNIHTKKKEPKNEVFQDEIILIITLVVSLLLVLSNFNLSGKVGEVINSFTFGMVGFIAYLLPFFLFFGIAFGIANKGNRFATAKLRNIVLLSVVLTAFLQILTLGYEKEDSLLDYYNNSAAHKNGGGVIGSLILKLLHPLFGTVGTYIILLAFIVVLLMFLTGKAFLRSLGAKSEATLLQMKEKRRLKEEELVDEDGVIHEEGNTKRKAKTVLLKRGKQEMKADTYDITEIKSDDKHKASKNTSITDNEKSPLFESAINMEEIQLENTLDIPIQRGNRKENTSTHTNYEEQLKNKFGASVEVNTPISVEESPLQVNLDSDKGAEILNFPTVESAKEANDSEAVKEIMDEPIKAEETQKETPLTEKATNQKSDNSPISNEFAMNLHVEDKKEYVFPPLDLLKEPKGDAKGMSDRDLKETALKLQKTLESFGVRVTITNVSCGPAVTRYELQPEQGVKVSKITGLADDIKLNLAAADVRIEAPIPGKAAVGIEVPNKENSTVMFRELIDSKEFKKHPSDIAFAVGKDIGGQIVVTDIGKMPHLLIAGATGSGKSVCINTLVMSILYKANPSDVKLIMVDPKVVELSVYNGIPHLLIPVVTDPKKASAALNWAVMEMTERYKKFADLGVRDVKGYNEKIATVAEYQDERYQKLPQIVIIVDELADLMMVAPGEVEDAICRLAQMARAAGLHLIIATQRPSVNVITGLIKANIPSRIAFSVSSAIDSRTIIDGSGAEKLLGKGDMLFFPSGFPKTSSCPGGVYF